MSIGTGTSPFSLSRREQLSSNTPNSITTENQNDLRGEGLNQRIPFIQNMFRKKTRTFSNTSKNTGISIVESSTQYSTLDSTTSQISARSTPDSPSDSASRFLKGLPVHLLSMETVADLQQAIINLYKAQVDEGLNPNGISEETLVQEVMEYLQVELDATLRREYNIRHAVFGTPGVYYKRCLWTLRQLSLSYRFLPRSLVIQNVNQDGRYAVGGGGFADIYRGTMGQRCVCLKVLRLVMEQDEETRDKIRKEFCKEALIWRQLKHPNILPLLGVNAELFSPSFCLISPWMENKDIITYLKGNPSHNRQTVLSEVAAGLYYLHSRDPPILHGDIRGANILVMDNLHCCLADFGLTLIISDSRTLSSATTSAMTKGTTRWMAPELIMLDSSAERAPNNTSRDVYAFGCTLLEILTLRLPFHDKKTDPAVIYSLMMGERPARPQNVWYPDTIWKLTTRCWTQEATDRPNAQSIYEYLQNPLTTPTTSQTDPSPRESEVLNGSKVPELIITPGASADTGTIIRTTQISATPSAGNNGQQVVQKSSSLTQDQQHFQQQSSQSSRPAVSYPWSARRIVLPPPVLKDSNNPGVLVPAENPSPLPFPRYGHTLPATATRDGELYLFGGVVRDAARNDLYLLHARDLSATLIQTAGEIPSPRVAHASVIISDFLILWGGDTKANPKSRQGDKQDDRLYLLHLQSKEWFRVVADGPSPVGRYGHAVTMAHTSKFIVFGGQVDGEFFNDLWSFDIHSLQWDLMEPTSSEKPAQRTGHVCINHGDRIIIFGGTDGHHHYNDTWSFDLTTRKWSELTCIGFIPKPREGHAAALVDDVMYIFGGRGVDGKDLNDLAAFKLSNRRWYMFQNMGPAPSGRSGHAMASFGARVFVLGGKSFLPTKSEEENYMHVLDTKHIKYPDVNKST